MTASFHKRCVAAVTGGVLCIVASVSATPANKAALEKHYDKFLARNLDRCTTCHLPSDNKNPESLEEFPHNVFGARLRAVKRELPADAKKDFASRLKAVATEDADGDGVPNETEILLGRNPGDAKDAPGYEELAAGAMKKAEFAQYLASYRWQPFEPVARPAVPAITNREFASPIDAFVAAEHQSRGLKPRPPAMKDVLLRRVYLDLIGLSPTPAELKAFEEDESPNAYEKAVDRLLNDPRHGERWGRHWMDVWRYSDWAGWSGGNQIRDSKPHIWKWRDWIVESLNADKGYDKMIVEMLAADELAPEDTNALRATGFLVRNYKMLSREQWLEDTVKHTSMAFLGVTMGCAKCHDHMTDPISQAEYYSMRAIFEPHWVRTDPVPGETNLLKAGLVRVYDVDTNPPTFFLNRGDERKADTNRILEPDVPRVLGGKLEVQPVSLPIAAGHPDKREFVYRDLLAAADYFVTDAKAKLESARTNKAAPLQERELSLAMAEARRDSLAAVIDVEKLEFAGKKNTDAWKVAATNAVMRQRSISVVEAKLKQVQATATEADARKKRDEALAKLTQATNAVTTVGSTNNATAEKKAHEKASTALTDAKKKTAESKKALADAEAKANSPLDTNYKPRTTETFPTSSTGRRLAFARWIAQTNNPLTARVAVNHVWMRHFGKGLVATPENFGRAGKAPSHPQLLDWLASEFVANDWSFKKLHRLIVTSDTYRMASTPDESNMKIDPDNVFLWRMNSRRMEAEVVRDNLLHVSGSLDSAMGGPDIDNALGLKSRRRSLYLRLAAEKEVEFLKIFDGPAVTECYARRPTVVPQQALALVNSELTVNEAKALAKKLAAESGQDSEAFARNAFTRILARTPRLEELNLCREFLDSKREGISAERARENLVSVLFNHNEFLTIR